MGAFIDLTGQKFGMLTVVERVETSKCGSAKWLCKCDCGQFTVVRGWDIRNQINRQVSCGCWKRELGRKRFLGKTGSKHPNWKGGRHTTKRGYVNVYAPEHPNSRSDGYVFEHTKVMSEHLDRPLLSEETVHHKNGIRDDNRIENLELWAKNHGCGSRVTDQIAYALRVLKQYAPETLSTEYK